MGIDDLIKRIADLLKIDPSILSPQSAIGRVEGWDSLQHLNLMVSLAQEHGLDVDAGVLAEIQSIQDIQTWLTGG